MTEADLARQVIKWLEEHRYDVYQEVQIKRYDRRADIVAVMDRRVWVIETKTTLSLSVIEQATAWAKMAHWVSVAVPVAKKSYTKRAFAQRVMSKFGVGYFSYDEAHSGEFACRDYRGPLHRKILPGIMEMIDEHGEDLKGDSVAAGSNEGGYWTPFRHTCRALTSYVAQHQGCLMKEAIDGITHHYASAGSARGALAKYIKDGIVEGLVLKIEEGKSRLYWDRTLVKINTVKG